MAMSVTPPTLTAYLRYAVCAFTKQREEKHHITGKYVYLFVLRYYTGVRVRHYGPKCWR